MRALCVSLFLLLSCTTRAPETPVLPTGILWIEGAPQSSILLLDEESPFALGEKRSFRVLAGRRRLQVECEGYVTGYYEAEVPANGEKRVVVKLTPRIEE